MKKYLYFSVVVYIFKLISSQVAVRVQMKNYEIMFPLRIY